MADVLIFLAHVIAYYAIYIGGNLCHGMHDPACDDELSRATMRSAISVCMGHMLLKMGSRHDVAQFRCISTRQAHVYDKLALQQRQMPEHEEGLRQSSSNRRTTSMSRGISCLSCVFRAFRVCGALLVIMSIMLNIMLILVSNNEISMSSWETVTP